MALWTEKVYKVSTIIEAIGVQAVPTFLCGVVNDPYTTPMEAWEEFKVTPLDEWAAALAGVMSSMSSIACVKFEQVSPSTNGAKFEEIKNMAGAGGAEMLPTGLAGSLRIWGGDDTNSAMNRYNVMGLPETDWKQGHQVDQTPDPWAAFTTFVRNGVTDENDQEWRVVVESKSPAAYYQATEAIVNPKISIAGRRKTKLCGAVSQP